MGRSKSKHNRRVSRISRLFSTGTGNGVWAINLGKEIKQARYFDCLSLAKAPHEKGRAGKSNGTIFGTFFDRSDCVWDFVSAFFFSSFFL